MRTPQVRWAIRSLGLVVALALLGTFARYIALPEFRPTLRQNESYVIDVSNYQGDINWEKVVSDGIGLAYMKATEGATYRDDTFAANWHDSAKAGVQRGAYHFFTECASGSAQAANFLQQAPPDTTSLRPAVDLEILEACRNPLPDVNAELDTFLRIVQRAWGTQVLVYARSSWVRKYRYGTWDRNPRWVTSYITRPDDPWVVWQVHYVARVDGINGSVDLDVARSRTLSRR